MEIITRKSISNYIFNSIFINKNDLKKQYQANQNQIGYFFIDDLLPK